MALLAPVGVKEEAKAMTLGAKEYGDHNYRGGITVMRLLDACLRHIWKCIDGADIDPDSGELKVHHLGCAKAELGMALQIMKERPDLDDRYKKIIPPKFDIILDPTLKEDQWYLAAPNIGLHGPTENVSTNESSCSQEALDKSSNIGHNKCKECNCNKE